MRTNEHRGRLITLAAMLLAALVGGVGIGQHALWNDEAETALFAHNIVEGRGLAAWNGDNLISYNGGSNLDDHLRQNDVPPLQYYVTAFSFRLFGVNTIAARLPFLLFGVASLWILFRWALLVFGPGPLSWLPPVILSTRLAFLLYLPQCRYYALTIFFACAVLWSWSACMRRPLIGCICGGIAMLGLFEANFLDAIALFFALCVTSQMQASRNRLIFMAAMAMPLGGAALVMLGRHDLLGLWQTRHGSMRYLPRFCLLIWRQTIGIDQFQFFPTLPLLLLPFPWLLKSLRTLRASSGQGFALMAMMAAYIIAMSAISPQNSASDYLDMRYDLPIFLIGSLVTAVSIAILIQLCGRWIAAMLSAIIMVTVLPYRSPILTEGAGLIPLYDHWQEFNSHHPSGMDAWLMAARIIPAGSTIGIHEPLSPHASQTASAVDEAILPLMFYRPDLRYIGVLNADKPIVASIRATLPAWVFCCADRPDYIITGMGDFAQHAGPVVQSDGYRMIHVTHFAWFDASRPELPQHIFHIPAKLDRNNGVAVLARDASAR